MTGTERKWVERVHEWKDSGKRAEEFATGRPYKASTLRWWATKLRRGPERSSEWGADSIPMARVVRRSHPRELELGPADIAARGVVVEVSGARIAVTRGFDAELLSEVVRVLAGA
jgi:hypothetical protein